MTNPHDHPTALKDLQDSIYREKILRARAMTTEERFIAGVELTNSVTLLNLAGAMARIGTTDEQLGWTEAKRLRSRLNKTHDFGMYVTNKPIP
jgi:hypothetical protein